jgi:hypothetical protein
MGEIRMKRSYHPRYYLIIAFLIYIISLTGCNQQIPLKSANEREFHTPPDKWAKPRIYHTTINRKYDQKITVNQIKDIEIKRKVFSDNRAYWYAIEKRVDKNFEADESLYVFNERDYLIKIDISRIDSRYNSRANWINEKLIYYQWWWGRILGGYVIFDVEKEEILQKELVKDGGIAFQQFQQAKKE